QLAMLKLGQCLSNGGARNAELFRQLVLAGEFEARFELPAAYPCGEGLHDILPLRNPNRLVHVYTGTPRGGGDASFSGGECVTPTPACTERGRESARICPWLFATSESWGTRCCGPTARRSPASTTRCAPWSRTWWKR